MSVKRKARRLDRRIGYMDGIDWQHHIGEGNDPKGTRVFQSVELTRRGRGCLASGAHCGIVKVEVRLVGWVVKQDLHREFMETQRKFTTKELIKVREILPKRRKK